MKKILSIILLISIVMCLCSCRLVIKNPLSQMPTEEVNPQQHIVDAVEEEYPFLDVYIYEEYKQEYDGNTEIFEGEQEYIILGDEDTKKFPLLATALKKFNADKLNQFEITAQDYIQSAKDVLEYSHEYFYSPYTTETKYSVQRGDETVLSVLMHYSDYMGGAHGLYGYGGITFDVESGEELAIDDVCTNLEKLGEIICNKMREEYPGASFNDLEGVVATYTADKNYNWTINNSGMTIYFQPYELASYAEGAFSVTILFKDYPYLFNEKFTQTPDSYIMTLTTGGTKCDLDESDNNTDLIYYYFDCDNYGDYTGIHFEVNGNTFSVEDLFFYDTSVYLVHFGGENATNYLMVECYSENDSQSILVFKITANEIYKVEELSGTGMPWQQKSPYATLVPLNPDKLYLSTRIDPLSTMSGYKYYRMDCESGKLMEYSRYYLLNEELYLTSIRDLEVMILEADKKEIIPSGTRFGYLRTDNSTYVDFKLPDGRECRVSVKCDEWPQLVNGMAVDECFEGMMYAG